MLRLGRDGVCFNTEGVNSELKHETWHPQLLTFNKTTISHLTLAKVLFTASYC